MNELLGNKTHINSVGGMLFLCKVFFMNPQIDKDDRIKMVGDFNF